MSAATILKTFQREKTVLLTTYRRNGTAVGTPVSIAVDNDRVLFRTWETSGKVKRLRHTPEADMTPCTFGGRTTGLPIRGVVRPLDGAESENAARRLALRHPVLQRWAVPLSHRLLRYRTMHFELRPFEDHDVRSEQGWPD